MFISAMISSSVPTLAEPEPDPVVAALLAHAGRDEVAHAGETGEGERLTTHRHPEPVSLGEGAGDEGGQGVVAEAETVRHAGGDRHDVLQRTGRLGADDVGVGVHPKGLAS